MKERDLVTFGALAGFIGNIPKIVVGWIFHFLGYLRYTFEHIAAGLFVPSTFLDNPVSIAIGVITDWIIAGIMGIFILWLIRKTKGNYPIIKGLFISSAIYVFFYGAGMAVNITRASLLTPLPNLLLLFPHLLFGATVGWFIKKFHDY